MRLMTRVLFLIGVIAMLNSYGCSDVVKFDTYSSKDAEINIAMDYVSGWLYSESRGANNSYAQVIFYEPQRKDKKFKAGMVITVEDHAKVTGGSSSASSFADALLTKRLKLKDMRVLSKSHREMFGTSAVAVELAYKTLDTMNSVDAQLIPVKEIIVIFERGNKFYTARYINTETEYAKFHAAFDHCIKSIKFKDRQ